MAKVKLDIKKFTSGLTSRYEILGLGAAVVLVAVSAVWGIGKLLGASSPEPAIKRDIAQLTTLRNQGSTTAAQKGGAKKPANRIWDWPAVTAADAQFVLTQPFEQGFAGAAFRVNPQILTVDKVFQIDYLHTGIHTFEFSTAGDHLRVFKNDRPTDKSNDKPIDAANQKPGEKAPVVLAVGKRLVVVSATFPYHDQVELYRKALRLNKVEEVFTKGFAPTFEGLNVQRRKITSDGGKDKEPEWTNLYFLQDAGLDTEKLVLSEPIAKLLRSALYDDRWVDRYHDVLYGSSATPLPMLAVRDKRDIQQRDYPEITLPGIPGRAPPGPKREPKMAKFNPQQGNLPIAKVVPPFGPQRPDYLPIPTVDIQPTEDAKVDALQPDLKDQITGKSNPFSPYGTMASDAQLTAQEKVDRIVPSNRDPEAKTNFRAPRVMPTNAKALVRFIDVDVEPGSFYEYRIQIRMANPNYQQPISQLAYEGLAKEKELVSDWVTTQPIAIPYDDTQYYITNQEKFVSKMPGTKEVPGIDWRPVAHEKMVPFQVHRFLDTLSARAGGTTTQYYVADWTIAERLFVARGEPIGRKAEVDLKVWNKGRADWEVHGVGGKSTKYGTNKAVGLAVDFKVDPPVTLLDFTGGNQHIKLAKGGGFSEESAIEALLLMPDMTMKLRNSRTDTNEDNWQAKERHDRFEIWKFHIDELTNLPPPAATKKGLR